eukprot:TRINITY_DN57197_c0_g1_i1.p1 TRINITY_DN57197_c0_g1~~TRINITY_DN57197_c0_g1_i1.p1  ORF type:complete len:502 (-),score=86.40 TRINITY_DN57197_c0_g1_i1:265-1770(-)
MLLLQTLLTTHLFLEARTDWASEDTLQLHHKHLSLGDSEDAMRIGFVTDKYLVDSSWPSICRHWPADSNKSMSATADSNNISASARLASNAFVRKYQPAVPQMLNWDIRFVQLEGLQAGKRYLAVCGIKDPASGHEHLAWPALEFNFRSIPKRWSFVAFGDLGVEGTDNGDAGEGVIAVEYTRRRLLDEVENRSAQFVLHFGDLAYALGNDGMWDAFMSSIEPIASKVPWMVAPGNHDILPLDSNGEKGVPMFARFWMPQQCTGQAWWYSYDYGGVHFVSVSTEHESGPESPQYAWLKKDLSRAAGKHKFVVVMGHRPMVSTHTNFGKDHDPISKVQWDAWQPLFEKYNVSLTLWGHVHSYERMYANGVPHVVAGTAGQTYCCGFWAYSEPGWSAYREDAHGYLRVNVDETHSPAKMLVQFVRSDDGRVADSFEIVEGHKSKPPPLHDASSDAWSDRRMLESRRTKQCTDEATDSLLMVGDAPVGLCPSEDADARKLLVVV